MNERVYFVGHNMTSADYRTAGTVTAVHNVDPDGGELGEPVIEVTFDDGLVDLMTWDDVVDAGTVRP